MTLEAQNGSMEAGDARNRRMEDQKNFAIEGSRPVVAVLHHFEYGPEPQISKQWDPDPD